MNHKMIWTVINLKTLKKESKKLTMREVEKLRKENVSLVYEVQNYPFIKKENHPLRWLD